MSGRFATVAQAKLADAHVQGALEQATTRLRVLEDLDAHISRFRAAAEASGAHTVVARTGADANDYVRDLCRRRGARLVAKSKSMVTEEIGLNAALEADGLRVVETDLGEYLVQLAGEHPVHIIVPAIEKTAADAAALLGVAGEPELATLTAAARAQLRETFLHADVGVTGANFGVCETGSICLVTNEGNGRFVSAVPPVHVVLIGMERLVANLADLAVLLHLLARSATGQALSAYTTLITGPRRAGEADGPEELHIVIVDNGRRSIADGRYREMLACIRCGACLNVCPVYRKTGGLAYSDVYSGPMGAVLQPLLAGLEGAAELPHACSLCLACADACPVRVPLPDLLLELRRDLVDGGVASWLERAGFTLWSFLWSSPLGYRLSATLARVALPLAVRVGPGRVWSAGRTVPRLGRRFGARR